MSSDKVSLRLEERTKKALAHKAHLKSVSVSRYIRDLVDRDVWDNADDPNNVSVPMDEDIQKEAFRQAHLKSTTFPQHLTDLILQASSNADKAYLTKLAFESSLHIRYILRKLYNDEAVTNKIFHSTETEAERFWESYYNKL